MKRTQINIRDYTKNAANNFSYKRLIIYTSVSLVLTILLMVSMVKSEYTGKALIFSSLVLLLIAAYTILNIIAIIKKSRS